MEKILAIEVTEEFIELSSSDDLEKVYNLLEAEEDFILQHVIELDAKNELQSEVIVATNIASKIKTGEILLKSKEIKGEK